MLSQEWHEIRACLPVGRTLFHYERGWYPVMLLGYLLEAGWTVAEIRRSVFARLLETPPIKQVIAGKGRPELVLEDLETVYQAKPVAWRLSLASWGTDGDFRDLQITRRGFNLVLQINFSGQHNCRYRQLVDASGNDHFNYRGHPVSKSELTLAWVRLDVDLEHGQALIEEIQSDWVREARYYSTNQKCLFDRIRRLAAHADWHQPCDFSTARERYGRYFNEVLPEYAEDWPQTAMAAALQFCVRELGIRDIFVHDFETGNALKHINGIYGLPPRSIYTDLPRKFCFVLTSQPPVLALPAVQKRRKAKKPRHRVAAPQFWRLAFEAPATGANIVQ